MRGERVGDRRPQRRRQDRARASCSPASWRRPRASAGRAPASRSATSRRRPRSCPRDARRSRSCAPRRPMYEGEAVATLVRFLFDYEQLRRPVGTMSGGERTPAALPAADALAARTASCSTSRRTTSTSRRSRCSRRALEGYDGTVDRGLPRPLLPRPHRRPDRRGPRRRRARLRGRLQRVGARPRGLGPAPLKKRHRRPITPGDVDSGGAKTGEAPARGGGRELPGRDRPRRLRVRAAGPAARVVGEVLQRHRVLRGRRVRPARRPDDGPRALRLDRLQRRPRRLLRRRRLLHCRARSARLAAVPVPLRRRLPRHLPGLVRRPRPAAPRARRPDVTRALARRPHHRARGGRGRRGARVRRRREHRGIVRDGRDEPRLPARRPRAARVRLRRDHRHGLAARAHVAASSPPGSPSSRSPTRSTSTRRRSARYDEYGILDLGWPARVPPRRVRRLAAGAAPRRAARCCAAGRCSLLPAGADARRARAPAVVDHYARRERARGVARRRRRCSSASRASCSPSARTCGCCSAASARRRPTRSPASATAARSRSTSSTPRPAAARRCSRSTTSTASSPTTTPSATSPATRCSSASAATSQRRSPASGTAYRMGGDEFCVARPRRATPIRRRSSRAPRPRSASTAGASASAARTAWSCSTASGPTRRGPAARRPAACTRTSAAGASTSEETVHQVLLSVVGEHDGALRDHVDDVARLAEQVGRRLGLDDGDVAHVRRAAALHDVGKIAIPDDILHAPRGLSPEEWDTCASTP